MIQELLHQTVGGAIGAFIGSFAGLWLRKRRGNVSGLVRQSVFQTSVLVTMAVWVVLAGIRAVQGA
ncbi:MAG: hypothetical protein JXQ89_09650 [Pelagimonas sp.]